MRDRTTRPGSPNDKFLFSNPKLNMTSARLTKFVVLLCCLSSSVAAGQKPSVAVKR